MKQSPSNEPDSTFGRTMLTLRTTIGLTQVELAKQLGVSQRAVGSWENGTSIPKVERLKQLIVLGLKQQAFPTGHEEEAIRAFWRAARPKDLLNESWLASQLHQQRLPQVPQAALPIEQIRPCTPTQEGPRVDWGEALALPTFYGREQEQALLSQWILHDRCQLISVLGLGGIGKSALVIHIMYQLAKHFQVVIFRSLRDAPSCETFLNSCLQAISPQSLSQNPPGLEQSISLLLRHLRTMRILLVIDNLEALLSEGEIRGHLRPEHHGYTRLLQQVTQTTHHSCLLLTSREKPAALQALEGKHSPVRSLRLLGLDAPSCEALLAEHELVGSQEEQTRLIEAYSGNPLALKIVAQTIADLFGGAISPFLTQNIATFGHIWDLLDEQYSRLSSVEQTVLSWLAILREPVNMDQVRSLLVTAPLPGQLLEAVDALRRRSLVEQGQRPGSVTLQSVILEYVTARLIVEASHEIQHGPLSRLVEHGFSQAYAKEYVRQAQERLLLSPLLVHLQSSFPSKMHVEGRLCSLLNQLRTWAREAQGYAPANLVLLLRLLCGDLRGRNLSHLSLRGLSLQGVQMQDATLAGSLIQKNTFTEILAAIYAVVVSKSGRYWAAEGRQGEIRVWKEEGQTLHLVWQAHTDNIFTLAFSPDEHLLASASWDRTIKLWNLENGSLLWTGWHTNSVNGVVFAPDGHTLASGGDDAMIYLWETIAGTLIQTQAVSQSSIYYLVWSPDGKLLACCCQDGTIHLWQVQRTQLVRCIQVLTGHTGWVLGLAIAPDGTRLVSSSWDGTVRLWEIPSGRMRQLQTEHKGRVRTVVWSPDGRTIAYTTYDHAIWLWDVERDDYRAVLHGHTNVVHSLAFTPDSRRLLSGGEDSIIRVWDVATGACLRTIDGYSLSFYDIDWSPTGSQLASADTNSQVTLWDVSGQTPPRVLHGHSWIVHGVAWSPNGQLMASSEWANAICLWNPATGQCLQMLRNPDAANTFFQGIAWSPDGHSLATSTYTEGIHVWDVLTGKRSWVGHPPPTKIRRVAWHPDGSQLASCGDDGSLCLWNAPDGSLLQRLQGHQGMVANVAWNPNGKLLASCGGGQGGRELLVWDVPHGERIQAFVGPAGILWAVAWDPSGNSLVSGDSDGVLRWWERESGACVLVRQAHQGAIQSLKVSPDGQILASCGDDGAIMLWNLQAGEHLRTLRHDRPYERLDITGIGGLTQAQKTTLLALGAIDKGVRP